MYLLETEDFHGEGPGGPLWGVIDCARDDKLYHEVRLLKDDAVCLFIGVASEIVAVSPHLVRLREGGALLDCWRTEGLDKAWGVLFRSMASQHDLRKHFRTKLRAVLPDGRRVLVRFWDPRVNAVGALSPTK